MPISAWYWVLHIVIFAELLAIFGDLSSEILSFYAVYGRKKPLNGSFFKRWLLTSTNDINAAASIDSDVVLVEELCTRFF